MALTSLKCPNCGADVEFSGDVIGNCPYCDSQVYFNDIVDRVELERLRRENYEQSVKNTSVDNYLKQIKRWRKIWVSGLIVLAVLIFAGGLVLSFGSVGVGAMLILLACSLFLSFPLIMGISRPYYDDGTGGISGAARTAKVFALYGITLMVALVALFATAMLAVEMGYESESEKEDSVSSAMQSEDCDILMSKWADSMFDKNGGEVYYSALIPASVADEVKSHSAYKELVSSYKHGIEIGLMDRSYRVVRITKLDALTDNELIGAENYFSDQYGGKFTAMQGYEYDITIEMKDKSSGSKDEFEAFACAVKLKGDGWTIIDDDKSLIRDFM
ncbi:MAG: hypothetical protein IKP25_00305 [Ruminococcus sp.]|nr:hypothetical protein [Ruminococcus sp.]